jgi:hypothetical protein
LTNSLDKRYENTDLKIQLDNKNNNSLYDNSGKW